MTTLAEERKRLSKVIDPQTLRHSEFLKALSDEKILDANIRKRLHAIGVLLGYRPEIDVSVGFQFVVGATYPTMDGKLITIVEKTDLKHYECVVGSDGVARYNRSNEHGDACLGRVTGTNGSDPRNLIPLRIIDAGLMERKARGAPPCVPVFAQEEEAEFIAETPEQIQAAVKERPRPWIDLSEPKLHPSHREFLKPLRGWRISSGHKAGNMRHKSGPIQIHADDGESLLVSRYGNHDSKQKFWIGKEWIYSEVTGKW